MDQVGTVGEMLQLAIKAERMTEALYDAFGKMFINHPEVASFWERYANEEAGHARWLESLRSRVSADQLSQPANPEMWAQASRLVANGPETLLNHIHDLQDAWELANEIEHGETNVIFEFLISSFTADPNTLAFLRSQLRDHLDHLLIGFPAHYNNIAMRRAIHS